MELELSTFILLAFCGIAAGFIDSIAGGGGLLTVPALLSIGIPPAQALATNKLQSSFGSFSATFYFLPQAFSPISAVICPSLTDSLEMPRNPVISICSRNIRHYQRLLLTITN